MVALAAPYLDLDAVEKWIARALCFAAALVIVALSEPRLNSMTAQVRPGFRLAFVILAVGGVWQILDLFSGTVPPWSSVALRVGVALLLLEERSCPRSCSRGSAMKRGATVSRRPPGPSGVSHPPGA